MFNYYIVLDAHGKFRILTNKTYHLMHEKEMLKYVQIGSYNSLDDAMAKVTLLKKPSINVKKNSLTLVQ